MAGTIVACNDASFGPVSDCRFFDFTATFSNVVLGILPASIALVCFVARLYRVRRKGDLVTPNHGRPDACRFLLERRLCVTAGDVVGSLAALASIAHAALNVVVLGLLLSPKGRSIRQALQSPSMVASTVLALVTAATAVPLGILERRRTRGGAMFLPLWLFFALLCDSSRIRSFAAMAQVKGSPFFYVFVVAFGLKAVMLGFENSEGVEVDNVSTREGRASFFSRLTFAWLMPLLWSGYRRPITIEALDPLKPEFGSDVLYRKLVEKWSGDAPTAHDGWTSIDSLLDLDAKRAPNDSISDVALEKLSSTAQRKPRPGSRPFPVKVDDRGLIVASMLAFPQAFFAPVPWVAVRTGSRLALPFLVSATLSFVQSFGQESKGPAQPTVYGWGLVGAFALVYLCLALSEGQYWWSISQQMVKLRGAMVELIYRKGLVLHLDAARKIGGGKAANLMSVDTERIVSCVYCVHELWSGFVSLVVGCYILYSLMGLAFLAPILAVTLCLAAVPLISNGLGIRQKGWSEKTDARVKLTASAVTDIKGVKLSAYEDLIESKLLKARDVEISAMKHFYSQLTRVAAFSNLIGQSMVIVAFITLILVDKLTGSRYFTLNTIFTATTVVGIVQQPLMSFGQDYAKLVAASASIKRIEAFLKEAERGPCRERAEAEPDTDVPFAAVLDGADIAWKDVTVLRDISIEFPKGCLTMICGRLGEGKTTLVQTLMGETDIVKGTCKLPLLASEIGYVSQDVWLQESSSIRQNIVFSSDVWDPERFATVLRVCALEEDVAQLAAGVETKASALSGGQRQRVAVARALYSGADTYVFDDITSALDAETAAHMWRSLFGPAGLLKGKTVVMATNAAHLLSDAALVVRIEGGRIVEKGSYERLSLKGKQAIARSSQDSRNSVEIAEALQAATTSVARDKEDVGEEVQTGGVGIDVIKMWAAAAGAATILHVCVYFFLEAGLSTAHTYLLQAWALEHERRPFHRAAIYGPLWCLMVLTAAASVYMTLYITLKQVAANAGRKLHALELRGVAYAPLSFFDGTPAGRITNRFSQDLNIVDFTLPLQLVNAWSNLLSLLAMMATLVVPAPYLTIVCLLVIALAIGAQRLYAPASRQLRRLEMATKSPLYGLFGEVSTVPGLTTLRGLRREAVFSEMNSAILDKSQKPYSSLLAVRRWLQTWLLLFTMLVNTVLVVIVVLLRHTSNAGVVGVALVQATMLGPTLNVVVIGFTEAEIAAVAVERIRQFSQIAPEDASARRPASPASLLGKVKGSITFDDLTVSYRPDLEPAIKGLSFRLQAGKRLGIVGRSGSGKSTTLLALFRMLEARSGRIEIDGVPITEMPVKELRSMMTIVAQSPLILAATVRDNLDPEGACEDEELWKALRKCHLAELVKKLPLQLGEMLGDGGAFLSGGQRQLLALARAVLRKRKILVLDEATSAMDVETDAAVQNVLRTQFDDCTIIAVAHRIATIINFDQIVCMQAGVAIESGSPADLLKKADGAFRALAAEQKCI
ncbi:hypothetical protein ACQY0O_001303 [Thecaphora frezii]